MLASIPSATVLGVRGSPVTVEVFVGDGLPGYHMVGMPDTACRESRDRVRAAIISAGFGWPNRCITVNLAPTSQRKSGAGLDLAIAIGVLVASEQLSGDAVAGTRSSASSASTARSGVCPASHRWSTPSTTSPWWSRAGNVVEAQIAARGPVLRGADLATAVACLSGIADRGTRSIRSTVAAELPPLPDLSDVRGQPVARRALEIAAAGGHHLLLVGSPGQRQDDAGAAPRRPAPAARPGPGAGDDDGALGGRAAPATRRARAPTAVPGAAPHHLGHRTRRRRLAPAAARRGIAGQQRSAVHGRARRVRQGGARGTSRAARGGRHPRRPGGDSRRRCRPASCSSRPPTRARAAEARPGSCECDDGARASVPAPAVGADHRSLRPAGRRPPPRRRRAPRRRAERVVGDRAPAGRRGTSSRPRPVRASSTPPWLPTSSTRSRRSATPPAPCCASEVETRPPHRSRLPPGPQSGADDRRPRRARRRRRSRSPTSSWRCRCGRSLRSAASVRRPTGGSHDGRRRADRGAGRARRLRADHGGAAARAARPPRTRRGARRRRRPMPARTRPWRRCSPTELRSAWARSATDRSDRRVGRAVRSLRHRRGDPGRSRLPRRAADRSATACRPVLAGRLVGARRPARRHRRHAQRHRPGSRLRRHARLPARRATTWRSCPAWPRGSTARPTVERCGPDHGASSAWWPTDSTRRTRGSTPTCGRPWPATVCCCRSGRRARSRRSSGSRSATASSPR